MVGRPRTGRIRIVEVLNRYGLAVNDGFRLAHQSSEGSIIQVQTIILQECSLDTADGSGLVPPGATHMADRGNNQPIVNPVSLLTPSQL